MRIGFGLDWMGWQEGADGFSVHPKVALIAHSELETNPIRS